MTLSRHHLASGPEFWPRKHPLDVGKELPEPACTLEREPHLESQPNFTKMNPLNPTLPTTTRFCLVYEASSFKKGEMKGIL